MAKVRSSFDAPPKPRKRRTEASMLRGLGFDPVVSSVWLYHQDHMTQNEIAKLLGVSRPTVVNYLTEGLRRGLVRIDRKSVV